MTDKTVLLIIGLAVAHGLAPTMTSIAGDAGFEIPEEAALITSIADGFIWTPLIFMWLGQYLGWIGMAIFAVIVAVFFFLFKQNEEAWEVAAGAAAAEPEAMPAPAPMGD